MIRNKKHINSSDISTNTLPFFEKIINKYAFVVFLMLSMIIAFVVYKDFFLGNLLFFFKDIGSDSINIAFPNFLQGYYMNESGEGMFKYWSFYIGMGQAYANPITLKPFMYLSRLFVELFGVDFWYYRVYYYYFFYIFLSGVVAYFYFRTINISKYVSIIGSLLFQFSGYLIIGSQWGHAYEVFYFMFLMFAFEQFLLKKRWFFFPIAVYFLSDNFYLLATSGVFLFLYSIVRYYDIKEETFKKYIGFVLKLGGLALLGVIMNSPRALFYFMQMYESPRVAGDVGQIQNLLHNPENINGFLRNVTTILRFYGNDLLGSGSEFKGWYNYLEAPIFYIGNISLLAFPFIFSYLSKKKKIAYGIFLFFWIAVAFIPQLRHMMNFYVGNYYKITIDIFVPFTLLFFSVFSLEKIINEQKINSLFLVISTGILLVLLHYPYFDFNNEIINFNMKIIISGFILLYALLMYLFTVSNNKSLIKFLFLLLVSLELGYISWYSVNDREVYTANELKVDLAGYNDGTFEALDYIRSSDSSFFYRIEKDYSSGNSQHSSLNDARAQGYFGTPSYGSFNQIYYIKFLQKMEIIDKGSEGQTRWCTGVRGIPILMSFANVKYFLSRNIDNPLQQNDYDSIGYVNDILILKNKHALPLGFTYKKYLLYDDFKNLSKFKKQELLLNAVIIDDLNNSNIEKLVKLDTTKLYNIQNFNVQKYSQMIDTLTEETFEIISFKHKKIEGKISIKRAKMLFFSIPYDKGWRIYVNGEKKKLQKVNIGFSGIYLEQGEYEIKLIYKPIYFELTLVISIISILIFVFLTIKFRTKKN